LNIAFVTNFCPHYRVKTFETLAKYHHVEFFFFSEGDEWYWQQKHGVYQGNFHYEYLPGFRLWKTRISLALCQRLLFGNYDMYIKSIDGRFALPMTYLIARIKRKPFILWTGIWSRIDTTVHSLFFPVTRYIYTKSDAVVTYGEHVKKYLISEGVSTEKIFIADQAIDNASYNVAISDAEKSSLLDKLKISATKKIILYLGRLEKSKGVEYLIKAFAALQRDDIVLVLAGEGAERTKLEELVNNLEIGDNTRFPGYIPISDTPTYYAAGYVFILPSITTNTSKEPWGLVINEAFNQGLPVITTDAVGAAAGGLVRDGFNGFVVKERDIDKLAQALQRILDDTQLRYDFGSNARATVALWDNEHMVLGFRHAVDYVAKK